MRMMRHRSSRAVLAGALAVALGGGALAGLTAVPQAAGAAGAARTAARNAPAQSSCSGSAPKITVSGTGIVKATPTRLTLSLDVHATSVSVSRALAQDNTAATAVIQALLAHGVTKQDITTADFTVTPNYSTKGKLTGYTVDETVVAQLSKLASAGAVIDATLAAGGNHTSIDSLAFSIANPTKVQNEARVRAVRQAAGRARAMATAAGERLGGICSIHDDTSTGTGPILPMAAARAPTHGAAGAVSTPVEAGSQTVTGRVSIVYALVRS